MKKIFASTCAATLLAVSASTAFAATNPFEDVPADHWAYDAVAQLAADGVIEGYGDGSYRGDQAITRYEMAQMVARAMTKDLSSMDKAMVDKLAAEFADELNSLGVRVANLEKKVDNVKWGGAVRFRYAVYRTMEDEESLRTNVKYWTLRLEPSMKINEHWTGHARIDYSADLYSGENATGANQVVVGMNDDATVVQSGIRVSRAWVQGDYKNLQILLGRLPYMTHVDGGMVYDDNVSGGQITYGDKIRATLTLGRSRSFNGMGSFPDIADEAGKPSQTGSYQAIEIYNDRADKFTWGVGFHRWSNEALIYDECGASSIKLFDIGLGYKFDKNFSIHGAYAWTNSPDVEPPDPTPNPPKHPYGKPEEVVASNAKRAWSIELDYKKANPDDVGSWGAFLAYRQLGQYAVLVPTYDAMGAGQRGMEVGVDYVFAKNVMGTVKYFLGKTMSDDYEPDDPPLNSAWAFFSELNFFF